MKFDDLFTRADEHLLQQILGEKTIRILSNLDQTRSYNKYIRKLIIDLYGYEGLLLQKSFRKILFDLLRENEARNLGKLLGISEQTAVEELYEKLKTKTIRRGSNEETLMFGFFELIPPIVELASILPSSELCLGEYVLFEHQRHVARKVKQYLNEEPFRVLLHMPTGSGKTRTAMNVIAEHFREYEPTVVVWLATSEELCEQAVEEFQKAWGYLGNREINVHRYWGDQILNVTDIKDGFIVAGLPKIVRTTMGRGGIQFISNLANKTSLVIMDEAHQAIAPTYKIILDVLFHVGNQNRLLGLSATPGRTWNNINADSELSHFFERRKVKLDVTGYANPIEYLIDNGYLARVTYRDLFHSHGRISRNDLRAIANSIDIPLTVLKLLGEDEQRNLKIISEVEILLTRHKRIILFAPSVSSSNLLACILKARGHLAYSVTGETEGSKRKQLIRDFKDNSSEPKVLCNYGVLTTGFDAPQTSAAVIARPTKSLVLYSQMIGRAIRGIKAGGNSEAEIVTILDRELPGFRTVAESFNNWEDVWE